MGALSRQFEVVALDRRGFGRSTAPPDLAAEIDDLLIVRRVLGLGPMTLVAMSQAGRVALHFALAHPESACGLVLQGAPLDGFLPEPRQEDAIPISSYAALARRGELERLKEMWRRHALMEADAAEDRALLDTLLDAYEARDLVAARTPALGSIAERLDDAFLPVLVMTGERDTAWRQLVGDALAYGLPHARRARIGGAPHLCNLTHPAEFNALVAGFASRLGQEAAAARQPQ
jgi:pimeloyl-ACP methyl ester carboxylesterase